jgi:endonuclease/exonuclease/phosphatase family metal-dependent hydrolase
MIAGDFNEQPDGAVHALLTGKGGFLVDSWRGGPESGERELSTAHHFTGVGSGGRIDWILTSPGIRVEEARIIDVTDEGSFPSDHFPYGVTIRIEHR